MAAENESGFMIDGSLYEMPGLDTFTMDEAQVLYDYSGLTLEDFAADDDDELEAKIKNPGFLRALMHVTYQRGNPKLPASKVKALIGSANVITALEHLAAEEEDAVPPALTTEPRQSSPSDSVVKSEPSGSPSSTSSETQDDPDTRTTTIGLVTSSVSTPIGSAA